MKKKLPKRMDKMNKRKLDNKVDRMSEGKGILKQGKKRAGKKGH